MSKKPIVPESPYYAEAKRFAMTVLGLLIGFVCLLIIFGGFGLAALLLTGGKR